jgi:hypothetical protein
MDVVEGVLTVSRFETEKARTRRSREYLFHYDGN